MPRVTSLLGRDLLLVLLVGCGLFLLLVGWVAFTRRPKRRRKRKSQGRKVYRQHGSDEEADEAELRRRYKYRYRRREHRARNPTLAETGGLPGACEESPQEQR